MNGRAALVVIDAQVNMFYPWYPASGGGFLTAVESGIPTSP